MNSYLYEKHTKDLAWEKKHECPICTEKVDKFPTCDNCHGELVKARMDATDKDLIEEIMRRLLTVEDNF